MVGPKSPVKCMLYAHKLRTYFGLSHNPSETHLFSAIYRGPLTLFIIYIYITSSRGPPWEDASGKTVGFIGDPSPPSCSQMSSQVQQQKASTNFPASMAFPVTSQWPHAVDLGNSEDNDAVFDG